MRRRQLCGGLLPWSGACNGASGLTDDGTVTVNTTPGMLSVEVSLANGVDSAPGGNGRDAIAFNIAERTSLEKSKVSTGRLSRDFTATSPFTATPRAAARVLLLGRRLESGRHRSGQRHDVQRHPVEQS
jgi:hypothetical protein